MNEAFCDPLPPSHVAWLDMNGEVEGVDPDYSAPAYERDQMGVTIEKMKSLGCTFYRWTRIGYNAGMIDAWIVRPLRQGRVGYGKEPEADYDH